MYHKRFPMKRIFILIITLILTGTHLSAREQYIYTQISHDEGLTSTINSIFKKEDGHLWIGSQNGLFRFNGTTLRHYKDPVFAEKSVNYVGDDSVGDLWVLTDDGLLRRKGSEEIFEVIETGQENLQFLSMLCDKDGIWLGSIGKIYRFTYESQKLEVFCDLTEISSEFTVQQILSPEEGRLMCCSHSGIILLDQETGRISGEPFATQREISAAMIDSKGQIWLAFYNSGIEVYSKDGTKIKTYRNENSALNNNIVLCLTERDSRIWAGTDGGGINIIDPETDNIKTLTHIAGDPSSLPAHSIKCIYTDSYGNIWAGSIRDGLIGVSSSKMATHSDVHIGMHTGLSNPTVLCLYQDINTEDIWIGTDGEGLNRFNPKTHTFTHYKSTLKTKVVSIASYSKTELAISVFGDRFWIFNKLNGEIRPMQVNDPDLNYQVKYAGVGINICNENDGKLLIFGRTLNRYDRTTGKCRRIKIDSGLKSIGYFLSIGNTDKGLWLHDNRKLYFLPTGAEEVTTVSVFSSKEDIRCGHIDKNGDIWLATSDGLHRFDTSEASFHKIPTSLFNDAVSVVCDKRERVWVGTKYGLFAYLSKSDTFAMFGKSDGADPNEYLCKARLLARSGDIFMGGVQGFLNIDASYTVDTSEEPTIKLHDVLVDEKKIQPDRKGQFLMPRNGDELFIRINVKEKDIFREKRYRFNFPNLGRTFETATPSLTLPRPSVGKHQILVSCTKRDGTWTEPVHLLNLRIPQPWYLSWWFIVSIIILMLGAATVVHLAIRQRRTERFRQLQQEQEQKAYEEKVQMLINISHELRTPLTLIMAPLKRLLKETSPDQESYSTLDRIYRQSRRMRDILNMVLDLRKMEVGKSRLKIETTDTYRWIMDVTGDIIDEEKSVNIDITVDVNPDASEIWIDRQKCETVMTNILMNAIKHSQSGDKISIQAERVASGIRISVSDQGPGLAGVDMEQIYTSFYQSGGEKYGSGIGLAYSKILVDLHGGSIGAYDNEDRGATFWWEVPLSPVSVEEQVTSARAYLNELMGYNPGLEISAPEIEVFNTSGMTLMLVDDNYDLLAFLREALSGEFADIIMAQSGNQALKKINTGKLPDIIVSDVNMPDGDGFQLCNAIKSNDRFNHIPVVLLTARGDEHDQSDSYKLGADGFIPKPFEMETLTELLRGLLRKRSEVKKRYLSNEDSPADFGSEEEAFIIRFNKIVSEHLSDPELDQQFICRELGVSRALLYNKMKAITGTGAKEYITRIRIEKAKNLMENPSLSIADIAEMTGFTSQSYFSTAFKSQTGMTPSQYRQKDRS